ncbi:hypothetical protein [Zavarzinia sp. CC-PAN008]|uniref:hypothetical protein n=1 Tax=Zavarzinia sp. CC-PAN008 TaxID=3243332 RepID=UPI003F74ACD2
MADPAGQEPLPPLLGRAISGALSGTQAVLWLLAPYGMAPGKPVQSYAEGQLAWLLELGADAWIAVPLLLLASLALVAPVVLGGWHAATGRLWAWPRWAWLLAAVVIVAGAGIGMALAGLSLITIGWGTSNPSYGPGFWLVPGLAAATGLWIAIHALRLGRAEPRR